MAYQSTNESDSCGETIPETTAIDPDSDDEDLKPSMSNGVTKQRKPPATAFKTHMPLYHKSQVSSARSLNLNQWMSSQLFYQVNVALDLLDKIIKVDMYCHPCERGLDKDMKLPRIKRKKKDAALVCIPRLLVKSDWLEEHAEFNSPLYVEDDKAGGELEADKELEYTEAGNKDSVHDVEDGVQALEGMVDDEGEQGKHLEDADFYSCLDPTLR